MIGRTVVILVALLTIACSRSPAQAHIHSQKVTGFSNDSVSTTTWTLSMISAVAVGACGVLPLALNRWIPLDGANRNSKTMQAVLSFAVGGLLGDVFLHLLPEAWGATRQAEQVGNAGLWVLVGIFVFMAVEKIAALTDEDSSSSGVMSKDVSGYLNLVANCTDNFTHGLAIAASYVVSPLVGVLTTLAIICHEVPHEVGDFAILLRSGFDCTTAAKAQIMTATGGMVGVVVGLLAEEVGQCTSWMLPFTAGGFLYISLVSILPELIEAKGPPLHQVFPLLLGIAVMAAVILVEKKSCNVLIDISSLK